MLKCNFAFRVMCLSTFSHDAVRILASPESKAGGAPNCKTGEQGGGRKRLPKFKFSAKFPIGLHVILQIQIKKFENDCYNMWKIILTENPLRCNLAPLLK